MGRPSTIELVRHGEAYRRHQWRGPSDRERPLDRRGFSQARAIADALAGSPVAALYSSPFVRCRQTLEPLGEAVGLPVTDEEDLGEAANVPVTDRGEAWVTAAWLGGRAARFLDRAAAAHAGGRVIACSHGDVIPAVLAVLTGRDALDLRDVHLAKGAWCTLEFNGGRCVGATLHPPPGSEDP